MKKQLQGIALVLFGLLLVMIAVIDPWIPIIEDISFLWVLGLASGIVGLIFCFKKDNE